MLKVSMMTPLEMHNRQDKHVLQYPSLMGVQGRPQSLQCQSQNDSGFLTRHLAHEVKVQFGDSVLT